MKKKQKILKESILLCDNYVNNNRGNNSKIIFDSKFNTDYSCEK